MCYNLIMKIALIDSSIKQKVYPMGLMRIGSYLKDNGHTVKLFNIHNVKIHGFDEYWISTIFTYDIPKVLELCEKIRFINNGARIVVGGISVTLMPEMFQNYEVHTGLYQPAEEYPLDYSILEEKPKYSITTTSRGCIRKCKFCLVPTIEKNFYNCTNWIRDVSDKSSKILFFDNNWLAKDNESISNDIETINKLHSTKRISSIDFNQGLDCRLITPQNINAIADLPIKPWRFSFDGMYEDGYFQEAVERIISNSHNKKLVFITNTLFNYLDKPQELYYRLHEMARLTDKYFPNQVSGFPMRYKPFTLDSKNYVGKHWTKEQLSNECLIRGYSFGPGIVSPYSPKPNALTAIQQFEFFYGRDEDEFIEMLNSEYHKLKPIVLLRKEFFKNNRYNNNFYEDWKHQINTITK